MKNKCKSLWLPLLMLVLMLLLCACEEQKNQYDLNDEAGYTVSVKFDANGGEFTTSCSVIVDSFNISEMATNSDGLVELALIAPDDNARGTSDRFTAARNGYFLAGWYASRTPVEDAEGNISYTYADKWDFASSRVKVDPNESHTASDPVVTLYAVWIPKFTVNFYTLGTNELVDTLAFDPNEMQTIYAPQWNTETGKIDMYQFPTKSNHTFKAAYYDAAGTVEVGGTVNHPGEVNYENGTAVNPSLDLYVDWDEGQWYHIYTAKQLADNATRNGCYEICADLDFTDVLWPELFSYGDFNGQIVCSGEVNHSISNVTIVQTDNAKTRFGLFGTLTDKAIVKNVTFRNVTATIQSGARTSGIAYGLFAGNISMNASVSGVQILESRLQIDSGCVLASNDYVFGLLCGVGNYSAVANAEITAVAVGDHPESVTINVDETNGTITVEIG